MEYDLEVVVPLSTRYGHRIGDFKKYGLFNAGNNSILVTVVLSGEDIPGVEEGWANGINARVCRYADNDYVSNMYRNFLRKKPESRWIIRLDDDSSTDLDGLLKNLDRFYDSDEKFYLASSLTEMGSRNSGEIYGPEIIHQKLYKDEEHFHGQYLLTTHEIECCVLSHAALNHIMSNEKAVRFLEKRCELKEGVTDVALAFASSIAKLWPLNLPFSSHLPLVHNFSTFGGHLNHIHMVARDPEGDNFGVWERCGEIQYEALKRSIDGTMTEEEKRLSGKRFIMETENELKLYEFGSNRSFRIKFENSNRIWIEKDGLISIFSEPTNVEICLQHDKAGNLVGDDKRGNSLVLKPVNF